jgi:hypothetical protein
VEFVLHLEGPAIAKKHHSRGSVTRMMDSLKSEAGLLAGESKKASRQATMARMAVSEGPGLVVSGGVGWRRAASGCDVGLCRAVSGCGTAVLLSDAGLFCVRGAAECVLREHPCECLLEARPAVAEHGPARAVPARHHHEPQAPGDQVPPVPVREPWNVLDAFALILYILILYMYTSIYSADSTTTFLIHFSSLRYLCYIEVLLSRHTCI